MSTALTHIAVIEAAVNRLISERDVLRGLLAEWAAEREAVTRPGDLLARTRAALEPRKAIAP